jgi:hypothetical protein
MSLIDEALKRARDQKVPAAPTQTGSKSGPPADPWAYAPLPHARRRSVALPWAIAGAFAAIAAAAAVAIWISRSEPPPVPAAKPPVAAPRAASETSSAPVSAPTLPAPGAKLPRDAGGPPARASAEPSEAATPKTKKLAGGREHEPERAAPARPVSTTTLNPRQETPPREAAAKPEPPPQLPRPASRAVDGRTFVGALVAPNGARVELGGIVYSETNASALLNGRILPVGAVVEGMTISAIHEDRVELSAEGLTVHLTLR